MKNFRILCAVLVGIGFNVQGAPGAAGGFGPLGVVPNDCDVLQMEIVRVERIFAQRRKERERQGQGARPPAQARLNPVPDDLDGWYLQLLEQHDLLNCSKLGGK